MSVAALPGVVHVPMPQGTQESTLLRVAERLSEAHERALGTAAVALAPGLRTEHARTLPVPYGPVRFAVPDVGRDVVWGRLGRLRP